jgi:hypothetical protein
LLGSIPEIPPRRLGKSLHAFSRTKASLKQSAFLHGLDPQKTSSVHRNILSDPGTLTTAVAALPANSCVAINREKF